MPTSTAPTVNQAEPSDTLLQGVYSPADLKQFNDDQLKQLADELRQKTVRAVSKTGGHLGAGLGVIELTVALHAVFDTPEDKLIWDVGHQCYPHKILTGRMDRIETLRAGGGLSGFTKRSESAYDPFGAAHSSTSISAGLGMAAARDHLGKDNNVIAVIGDGAMSAGMAYEALNNAGALGTDLIVILNDNNMSIAPPVGAMSGYLTRLISSKPYLNAREWAKKVSDILPPPLKNAAAKAEERARTLLSGDGKTSFGGTLFEELGFYYIGPIDGHDLDQLLPVLRNLKAQESTGPVLIHAITQKGKGYKPAELSKDKMHGVPQFDIVTGTQFKSKSTLPSYTGIFADTLCDLAAQDEKIIGITAAMPGGTGLDKFAARYPDRFYDVGIAEQHAVTFAAGLAAEGMRPFAAIYSTFLQRAYDQVVHDVAIQNLPVRFAIDRAGLVGADGATHAGSFDIAYLGCLPNMVLMAAADEAELVNMTATAAAYDDRPVAFRYPRGTGTGVALPARPATFEIGKGRLIQEGNSDIAILSYGGRLQECLKASTAYQNKHNQTLTIADARFAKPLDIKLIDRLVQNHKALLIVEDGSIGGFASYVLNHLHHAGVFDRNTVKVRTLCLPDRFIDQDTPDNQYKEAGLDSAAILKSLQTFN